MATGESLLRIEQLGIAGCITILSNDFYESCIITVTIAYFLNDFFISLLSMLRASLSATGGKAQPFLRILRVTNLITF